MKNLKRLAVLMMAVAMTVTQSNIATLAADINTSAVTVSENAIGTDQDEEAEDLAIPEYGADDDSDFVVCEDKEGNAVYEGEETEEPEYVDIDSKNFPDEVFERYVLVNFDKNKDKKLSKKEIDLVKTINIKSEPINNYKGIEIFTALENLNITGSYSNSNKNALSLNVSENVNLKTLVIEQKNIKYLTCKENNSINSITVKSCNVVNIAISDNSKLEHLDLQFISSPSAIGLKGNTSLKTLNFANASFDVSYINDSKSLEKLNIYGSKVQSLDLSEFTNLDRITIRASKDLESLDISKNDKLDIITVEKNESLTKLDMPKGAAPTFISIKDNDIQNIDFSSYTELKTLMFNDASISELDLSKNTKLEDIDFSNSVIEKVVFPEENLIKRLVCADSNLASIDLSDLKLLEYFECSDNSLTELDLSNNHYLNTLKCDNNNIANLNIANTLLKFPDNDKCVISPQEDVEKTVVSLVELQHNKNIELDKNIEVKYVEDANKLDVNEKSFPDEAFRKYVLEHYDIDKDGKLSEYEIMQATDISLNFEMNTFEGIGNLKYLKTFKYNAEDIEVEPNDIDFSSNVDLTDISIECSCILKINLSNNINLKRLYIYDSDITELDLSKNTNLEIVDVGDNCLEKITFADNGKNIKEFLCYSNNFTSLDLLGMINLERLDCTNNYLTELNLVNNVNLRWGAIYNDEPYVNLGQQIIKNDNDDDDDDYCEIKVYVAEDILNEIQNTTWYKEQVKAKVVFLTHEHEIDANVWVCDGDKHYNVCKICGEQTNGEEHKATKVAAIPSTCKERGIKEYYECKCGFFEDEKCTSSIENLVEWKKLEKNQLGIVDHKWDSGKITKQPSYTSTGTKSYKCVNCEFTKTEEIAKLQMIEIPVKGKFDVKPIVQYNLAPVSGNSAVSGNAAAGFRPTKFKYKIVDKAQKKMASVSGKGVIKAKKPGYVTVAVLGRNANKKYEQVCTIDVAIVNTTFVKKIQVNSLNEFIDLSGLVSNVPAGYSVNYSFSNSSAKKIEYDRENNFIKPIKKGTITVKCIVGEGKAAVKKNVKIVVKVPK